MADRAADVVFREAFVSARARVQALSPSTHPKRLISLLGNQALPRPVGMTVEKIGRALCLGPADWLIMSRHLGAEQLCHELRSSAGQEELAIVDVSDALATIEVSGPGSRLLLATGCGVDMHPGSFGIDKCTRTRFAELPVAIDCVGRERFEMHVARSFREYVLGWLADAQ